MKFLALFVILLAFLFIPIGGGMAQESNSTELVAPSIDNGVAFPEGEAGLAAYINSGQNIDLAKIKTIFSNVEDVGDNYIVGVVPISDWGGNIDVHLYADTDGWIVSYLKKDEPVSHVKPYPTKEKRCLSTSIKFILEGIHPIASV